MKVRTFLFFLLLAGFARADEGMWMLNRIDAKTAQAMKELGLQLTPSELYNPAGVSLKDAVVDFGDFCSGVVVSPNGLVFTNHHCGYGAIQKLSSPEDDILANGFVAHSYAEERPAEGLFVRFLLRTEECSTRVMLALDSIYRANPGGEPRKLDRDNIDSICYAIEEDYQKANPGMDCQVRSYYGGNAYFVSIYKVYRDIRLVFTGTNTMGKFGGDTDNWMWPRQTCDFSVFRIYADENGEPAEYSPDNKPLRSKRYAKVSLDGYQPGDYCMTIGYPGSTSRYLSSWGIDERVNARNVSTIQVRGRKQEVWKKFMDADRSVGIKYASKWASSSNYWKNSIGMNKAIADLGVIAQKQRLEEQIKQWYDGRQDLKARFGNMFGELEEAYRMRREDVYAQGFFNETFSRGIEIIRVAGQLNRMPQDADSVQIASTRESLQHFFKDYDAILDEATTAALLQNYREQVTDKQYWPEFYQDIDSLYNGDCAAFARDIFSKTVCKDISCLDKLLADSALRETDPILRYTEETENFIQFLYGKQRENNNIIDHNERLLTQALLEMDQEAPHYSDANFTMRLSYGQVGEYLLAGQPSGYYTAAESIVEKMDKADRIIDYEAEPIMKELLSVKDFGKYTDKTTGKLHLCFLSNNDITGGNSGSPMFNGKGELIGLAFDGNWDSLSSDIFFDSQLARCIGVDIRYVLYMMEKWGKADRLIKEIGAK